MSVSEDDADGLFAEALTAHTARDIPRTIALSRDVLRIAPEHTAALEHLATVLVTRQAAHDEGLALIERAVAARHTDAGLWYSLGWCYEFTAHEVKRRPGRVPVDPRPLYERAAEGFRQCLALHPDGKLQDDAEDLLDHVENELRSM